MDKPNPGSREAVQLGCICAIIDNGYGRGYHWYEGQKEPLFVIIVGCPVHK